MTRKSVLIVDDDPDIRDVLADTLESKGFDVVTAANGADALTVLCDTGVRPSVILLDLMMPVMDGYGFLERWRRDPALASIPIAIVTAGYGVDRDRLGDGLPIIPKPFNVPQLVRSIHSLCLENAPSA